MMLTLQRRRWWRRRLEDLGMLLLGSAAAAAAALLLLLPQHAQAFQPRTRSLGPVAAGRARAPSVVLRAATALDMSEEEGGEDEASLWWRPAVPTVRTTRKMPFLHHNPP